VLYNIKKRIKKTKDKLGGFFLWNVQLKEKP
jgi:hypothetical protein